MARTVIIADDDEGVRHLVAQILERDGYQVLHAESGEQAIGMSAMLHVDAFLLDLNMPKMNGIQVCRTLRAMENYRATPILFVTGLDEGTALEEALAAGGDDFINKPFNAVTLRARLRTQLERRDYVQRLERARKALRQYLSKRTLDVVEATSVTGVLPPPQEQDLAICFTDIRGFTALSEDADPSELFAMVSALLAEQVDIIHRHGGYVDKFGGDGVMAIFDGPEMVPQSCLCALSILDRARVKGSSDPEDIRRFGIGIHTGRAVIGNIGSPEHLDYSAIGSTVNLAARLCGQAQATSIVVSKAVRDAAANDPRLAFHSERQVQIRGIKDPVTIYTLTRAE
jgi:class 3 adenylate cyclase